MRDYLRGNKIVRNVGLGTLSLLSMVGLSGCVTVYTPPERTEPTKVIIQEKVIIEKEFVPVSTPSYNQSNQTWNEPTPYPPHPKGQPNHPVPDTNQNWGSNQYWNEGTQNTWQYGQDHPKGQPNHPVQ